MSIFLVVVAVMLLGWAFAQGAEFEYQTKHLPSRFVGAFSDEPLKAVERCRCFRPKDCYCTPEAKK